MANETVEFTPRPYQIDLYEQAVLRNTILYLPTGSGKTYIAVLLLKKLSHEVHRPYTQGGKRSIFAVNTVPLVAQQSDYIRRHTGLSCKGYSGDMKVDFWSKTQWMKELDETQVLVMTSQIFLDQLNHGNLELCKINLIVFDECHRGVNDHPMRQIMQRFESCPFSQQPRVLALSATLLNSNVSLQKIASTIESLEKTYHAKIATINSSSETAGFSTCPKEKLCFYAPYDPPPVLEKLEKILDDAKRLVQPIILSSSVLINESSPEFLGRSKNAKLSSILEDIREHVSSTGLYGANKAILLHLIQLELMKKTADNEQTVYVLEYLITELNKMRKLLDDEMRDYIELDKIKKFCSPNVLTLSQVLLHFYNEKENDKRFCCIVFVQRRFTAKVLYHVLKTLHEVDERFKFLLPDYIVGYSNDPYKNAKESLCVAKWNKEVLRRFRNGLSNCIIATDVVDEGVDIPLCTLIVRFDLPKDFRSYIQSKGRARHASSQYTFLICENNREYITKYYQPFQSMENMLQQILIGKTEYRKLPSEREIKDEVYQYEIKPLKVTSSNGTEAIITEQSAVAVVNRYCANLHRSKYVYICPTWILYKIDRMRTLYKVSLTLPSLSPLKDVIFGDVMSSINSAKRSAAMQACKELYRLQELKDNLLPRDPSEVSDDTNYLFPNWKEEEVEEGVKPGTVKKTRLHKIQHAGPLYGALPLPGKTLYMHILHAFPTYPVPHDNRHLVFYNLLSNFAGFAILGTKQMQQIPSFPIFMNVGELNVDVKVNHRTLVLSEDEINKLRVFHSVLLSQVVTVTKSFMVFDNDNQDNCFLLVPVDEKWEIDWDTVGQNQNVERIPPTPFHFKHCDYELALVAPSYRGSSSVYIVTQVCDDITPDSSFPTEDFYSYTHYYKEKHELDIHDEKQPMLEVKPISTKINFIKQRSLKPGLSKRRRADMLEDFEEHLVPELCVKVSFPALYWLKATTLPSILHRVTQLLVADELRHEIAVQACLGICSLPEGREWPPLAIIDENVEEPTELLQETIFDDTVNSFEPEPELNGPEIDVLNTEDDLYPWSAKQEPTDLDRKMEQIQLLDIEYYYQFMQAPTTQKVQLKRETDQLTYMTKKTVDVPSLQLLTRKGTEGPTPSQIMQALTTKRANDAFNLERLETLGDSYLKFIISLFLFHSFPSYNEGRLTSLKGKIIGNRNLFYCGVSKSLPGRMKVDDFVPMSNFIAPAYTPYRPLQTLLLEVEVSPNVLYELSIPTEERLSGYISSATKDAMEEKVLRWEATGTQTGMEHFLGVQTVSDKSVADCVEALIGIYLQTMSLDGAAKLLQWFEILPKGLAVDHLLYDAPQSPKSTENDPNWLMPWANLLESIIGYSFKDRAYLLQAFTHPSYTANRVTDCYQRLEFLGDAILDFLITTYIYENCGNLSPGALTDLRSALVNNIIFACLAVRHGLHFCLLAYAPKLTDSIDRFVKFQVDRKHEIDDELLWILLEEDECNMAEYVDVPKVLGDLFESLIGAIYLDTGKSLEKVWEIIYALMHKEIDAFSSNVPKQPLRVLWETQGAKPNFLKTSLVEGTDTVMVPLEVVVDGKVKLFHGFGSNKKQAKCAAAKQALKYFRCKK